MPSPDLLQQSPLIHLVDDDQAMIWRGPMATQALDQLLRGTRWRDLDYLLVDLPPGVTVRQTGDAEIMAEVFQAFAVAMISGVMLTYVVLVLLFHNFVTPISILMSLPLAIGGAILALFLTGNSISMAVVIGFLMLMGIVTKNAIMLVEFAVQAMDRGVAKREETQDITAQWHVAMRPGKRRALDKSTLMGAILDKLEQAKARIRAKVEHPFRVIKRQFGYTKVKYRGLAKNTANLVTLFALSNLWMARRKLLQGLHG